MDAKGVVNAIKAGVETLNTNGCNYRVYDPFYAKVEEFINAVNPNFPRDSVDVLDLLNVAVNHGVLPDDDEMDILKMVLRDADFYSGELRWKYRHPVLTAQFSPKHSGGFYKIRFVPLKDTPCCSLSSETGERPLTFPLKVQVLVYTDMDEEKNHSDMCPMYHPEHEEDCPLRIAYESDEIPESEEEQAALEAQCECAADDCNCQSTVERVEEMIFKTHSEWVGIVPFLVKAHWGGDEETA